MPWLGQVNLESHRKLVAAGMRLVQSNGLLVMQRSVHISSSFLTPLPWGVGLLVKRRFARSRRYCEYRSANTHFDLGMNFFSVIRSIF